MAAASVRFGLASGREPAASGYFGLALEQSGPELAGLSVFAWKIVPEQVRPESAAHFVCLHPGADKSGFAVPGAFREQSRKLT